LRSGTVAIEGSLWPGWSGDTFLFGSELKALVAHPEFRPEVDREALALFLRYGWIPGPRSIYRGVSKLEPGSFLHVEASGQQEPVSYWSSARAAATASADPFSGSAEEASDHLDALLRRAVSLRMVSDVPLGALLSGGIDSSTVVALMQEQSSRPVRTFSIGFNESEFDEAPYASAVAQHLGTQHTNLYLTPMETLDAIPKLPELYDEPFADVSQIPTFLLAQLTRRDVTVALSGDGGDELFLGYKRYFRAAAYWARLQRFPRWARRAAAELVRFRGRTGWWWDSLGSGWENPDPAAKATPWALSERHADRLEARNAVDLSRIRLGSRAGAKLVLGAREPDSVLTNPGTWPVLGNAMSEMGALDFMTYLRDDILVKVDRASMATSLEVRCPLLDREVVEFAWSLPVEFRIRGGEGKHVLREVLGRYVPRELTDRRKQGFGVPIGDWLRGELRDWSESLLDEKRMREAGFLDAEAVRRLWDQHQSRWADHSRLLWSILMFQAWNEVRN
jgi:asparagine synthase (glutamine-hydrolysing)